MELLIVIAIIGIMTAIATVSYSSAQKKTRDSRRVSDLKAIQNGFEQYNADNNGLYPATCSLDATYLPSGLPADPKTGADYTAACATSTYCFCATLEGSATSGNATDTSCTFGSGQYYCVKNLQ